MPQPLLHAAAPVLHTAAATFEAACQLAALPAGHRARRLHGHSYLATVRAALPADWGPFPGAQTHALREALTQCLAPLDHHLINDTIAEPTDENVARWIRQALAQQGVPGMVQVGVQSTPHTGVDLDIHDHAHLWRRYRFQAAHRLPNVPMGHKCGRMHGHGFEVILHVNQDMGGRDFSVDYDAIDAIWAPLHMALNYQCLNEIPGLENPTSEVISAWLWAQLKPQLPELTWVTVYETGSCGANYDGRQYRIWKELTLDSAIRLKQAPEGSPLGAIHGYTYTMRLHLAAELDAVMGWTVDFGDVKTLFDPIFKAIDHRPLFELADLPDGDAASLAQWVLDHGRAVLPQLDRVDLYETRGCGAIVNAATATDLIPV